MNPYQLDQETFADLQKLIYERIGVCLKDGKETLVEARIGKRMRALQVTDSRQYLLRVRQDTTGQELVRLLDAITTNTTSFFREPKAFEFTHGIVSQWVRQQRRRLRFWSAASSSGEEPYTLAMVLHDIAGIDACDWAILATDISTSMLARCQEGVYGAKHLAGVPPELRHRHFDQPTAGTYSVGDHLRARLTFNRLNLAKPPYPMRGPFDIVYCRNVMIYFDNQVRRRLLDQIHRLLAPDGYLIVGNAESLTGLVSAFVPVQPSIYRKI